MTNFKNLTPEEMEKIEEAAIRSAMNMGRPEQMGCGICGYWYLTDDFMRHPCVTGASEKEKLTNDQS